MMLLHGCALGERSSGGTWKFRTSSLKCYVDHSHTMYSSGNIDVRNWVHLFESPCILERGRPQMSIWHMRVACWITSTLSEYVIVTVFPLQQWLRESSSMLRYVYIACIEMILMFLRSINPLKPKRRLLYLKTQSVPRCKHFSSRL